jgi:PKD repeat protein
LQNPYHVFTSAGSYTILHTVTDSISHSDWASHSVTVSATSAPTAGFTFTPAGGAVPVTVVFTNTTTGGTPPYSNYWQFGDGMIDWVANPSHSYSSVGTYVVNLTVTDAHGLKSTSLQSLTTTAPVSGNSTVTANVTSAQWGDVISITIDNRGVTNFTRGYTVYTIDEWSLYEWVPTPFTTNFTWNSPEWINSNMLTTKSYYSTPQINPTGYNFSYQMIPTGTDLSVPWSGYVHYMVGMKNNTYNGGAWQYSATTQVLLTWVNPTVTWTPNPAYGGDYMYGAVDLNSFAGLEPQSYQHLVMYQRNTTPGYTWNWDYWYMLDVPRTDGQPNFGTSSIGGEIGSAFIAAYYPEQTTTGIDTDIVGYTILPTAKTGTIGFYDINGNPKTSLYTTDNVFFRFDTGNDGGYATIAYALEPVLYKYNEVSAAWDTIGGIAWIEEPDTGTQTAIHNYGTPWSYGGGEVSGNGNAGQLSAGTYRILLYTGGTGMTTPELVMQTAPIIIKTNPLNPKNIANTTGSFLGIGGSLGGDPAILLGLLIMIIFAVVLFFVTKLNVYGLLGGAGIGFVAAFALGLFPLWMIFAMVVVGIAAIAVFLFMGAGGSGGGGGADDEAPDE